MTQPTIEELIEFARDFDDAEPFERDCMDAIADALHEFRQLKTWRPIGEVPKDPNVTLLFTDGINAESGAWDTESDDWFLCLVDNPVAWMEIELPQPPEVST